MTIFAEIINKPVSFREYFDPRYDVSLWQGIVRTIRKTYRRRCFPNGPNWMKFRISSVDLIIALRRCSREEAELQQIELDKMRLEQWFRGF